MKMKKNTAILEIVICLIATACGISPTFDSVTEPVGSSELPAPVPSKPQEENVENSATATEYPAATAIGPTMTPLTSSTSMPETETPILIADPSPTPEVSMCRIPTSVSIEEPYLLERGQLLVHLFAELSDDKGTYFLPGRDEQPRLLLLGRRPFLGASETKLAINNFGEEINIYNLENGELIRIGWEDGWRGGVLLPATSSESNTMIGINLESTHIFGESRAWKSLLLNIDTQAKEEEEFFISLPDYYFDDRFPWYGYSSLNPERSRVLYTADRSTLEIVLKDLETDREIWSYKGERAAVPAPKWSNDGNHVLMVLYSQSNLTYETQVAILDSESLELNVIGSLYEEGAPIPIWKLHWSDDQRFVYLESLDFESPSAYIIDTENGDIFELCVPNFDEGELIPQINQVIYSVHSSDNRYEIWILDLETWNTQLVYSSDFANIEFQLLTSVYIGWTSIDMPIGEGD